MTDALDGLVEKACLSQHGERMWNGPNTIHPIERAQARDRYRAALEAVGLPTLLERVEAAEGALGHWQRVSREREGCICPSGPSYEGPQEDCSQHGRPYSYWVERADNLGSQVVALAAKVADAGERIAQAIEKANRKVIDARVADINAKPHIVDRAMTYAAQVARAALTEGTEGA